ncbi:2-keto-4-pentenoate hydratase/2-oxohepta-3-ene-1,7-dioic acid hydratase (catechol pathway) [Actinomadura madurae]|uniref:2-keto-4-pentenoate hydratase/2-oxohepta-3-ene-1,7-dioic acid hydratase (Catechol pathway) n=1 Tax=Actinomadura madurae TaxID=1993 RepID=A0A1I5LCN6_9ACTN|nr:fumarylacetoacetate hydrolase family protein [Actinomadura madurae]SFO95007.1 2-keto-4-pentenoate hydratase/2-oxohepta-3-ene-1,7-dioic acid hydratase (catechol pathway) [Actinomadura madurae]
MRIYSTERGIARETETGRLDLLDLACHDVRGLLFGPGLEAARHASVTATVPLGGVPVLAPVARPGKILIIGYNYPSHGDEVREARGEVRLPKVPNFQIVAGSAVAGPDAPVVLPKVADAKVDYEGEVAVVIGRSTKEVSADDAWGHVAGLTVVNDVSARDVQARAMAGDLTVSIGTAKSFDTFKPMGPCLVTADEFEAESDLRLITRVNGEVRQDDRTGTFVHSIPELVAYLSKFMTLEPGDVICTGTPRGVGFFSERFLHEGDQVAIEVERIGCLRNRVVSASTAPPT